MELDHIGIVVADVEQAVKTFTVICSGATVEREDAADGSMLVAILHCPNVKIELMQPLLDDSPTGKFLAKHGEGLHHLAFAAADIKQSLQQVAAAGIRLIDQEPRPGSAGSMVAFMHPKDTHRVLTEYCQHTEG